MIDKVTFIICLIKLLGLQIIIAGIFIAYFYKVPLYSLMLCVGSLIFAIGGNILLAINMRSQSNLKKVVHHYEEVQARNVYEDSQACIQKS